MCDHLHEQTSRYDHDAKVLTLLLVCSVCRTEKVVEMLAYEPRFTPCLIPSRRQSAFADAATVESLPLAA